MGGVFLRRARRPKSEIVNDANGEIVNLFRTVREHPGELARQFEWTLASRARVPKALKPRASMRSPTSSARPASRTCKALELRRQARDHGEPGTDGAEPDPALAALSAARMRRLITAAHQAAWRAFTSSSLDWADFIRRYDRPSTLFYLDPPYFGHEDGLRQGAVRAGRLRAHDGAALGSQGPVHPLARRCGPRFGRCLGDSGWRKSRPATRRTSRARGARASC